MIVAFSGGATIPQVVGSSLSEFAAARLTKVQSPEDALRDNFIGNFGLLKGCPPVVMMRNRDGPVVAQMIGVNSPPDHPWGLELRGCPDKACPWAPGDTRWDCKAPHRKATGKCQRCNLKTVIWRETDLPHVKSWGTAHPLIFKSRFPLTLEEFELSLRPEPIPGEKNGTLKRKREQEMD